MNTLFIQSLHALPWLLGTLIKATVILAVAWAACLFLKRASASTRHLIWSTALIAVLLLPCLSLALPRWRIVLNNAHAAPVAANFAQPPAPPPLPHALLRPMKVVGKQPSLVASVLPSSVIPSQAQLSVSIVQHKEYVPFVVFGTGATIWLVGFVFVLSQFVFGVCRIGQIEKQAVSLDDATLATAETIRLRLGIRPAAFLRAIQDDVAVPVTWGAFLPVVLLPKQSISWSEECLRAALLHELAHVQRWDWLTQTLARLTCALYWWHPLVWMAARQAREESERACDDFVLSTGVGAADYAQRLVEVVRSLPEALPARTVAIAMAQPSEVEGRVQAVLDGKRNRSRLTRIRLSLTLAALCLLLLPLSALRPVARGASDANGRAMGQASASLAPSMKMGRGILEIIDLKDVGSPTDASAHPYQIETIRNADGTQSNLLVNTKTGTRTRDLKTVQAAFQKLIDQGYTQRAGASAYLIPLNLSIDIPTRDVFFTPAQRRQANALEQEKTTFLNVLDGSRPIVTDADLEKATPASSGGLMPALDLHFTSDGSKKLQAFTASHHGAVLGIFIDGGLVSAPTVMAEIDGGVGEIAGGFRDQAEVTALAARLNQPAGEERITPISYESISPDGTEMIVRGGSADSVPVATGSVATLPNGYTVGVAGLTQAVKAGDKWSMFAGHWWKPDGTPLAARPEPARDGFWNWSTPQYDGNAPYVVEFTLAPPQSNPVQRDQDISTYEEIIGAENHAALLDRLPFTHGEGFTEGSTLSTYFAPGTKTCSVRCGVGAGPWQTAATLSVHLTPATAKILKSTSPYDRTAAELKLDDRPALLYNSADGKQHTEYFLGSRLLGNVARRVVAVDTSGREIPLQITGMGGWGLSFISLGFDAKYSLAYFNSQVDLAHVKAFRLETRPYQIVEFRNVQLQPMSHNSMSKRVEQVRLTPATLLLQSTERLILARLEMGQMLQQRRQYRSAQDWYREAVQTDPTNAEAQYQLACEFYTNKERLGQSTLQALDEAIMHLSTAITLKPENMAWHKTLNVYLAERGQLTSKVQYIKTGLSGRWRHLPTGM